MAEFAITLSGCDDSTTVTASLTDEEIALLERIAAATVAASQFSCMPRMEIRPYIPANWDEVPRNA